VEMLSVFVFAAKPMMKGASTLTSFAPGDFQGAICDQIDLALLYIFSGCCFCIISIFYKKLRKSRGVVKREELS